MDCVWCEIQFGKGHISFNLTFKSINKPKRWIRQLFYLHRYKYTSNKNIGHKIHKQINYKYVQHKRICNGMFWHYRVCINYLFKMPFRVDLTRLCHHKDGNLAKYFPETVVEKIGDVGWNILHQRNLHVHVQDHIPILLLFPI